MEEELKLANLVFGLNPVIQLEHETAPCFQSTNREQFSLFYSRLIKRTAERLSDQFGACVAFIEEKTGWSLLQLAKEFVSSEEYRAVREDLTEQLQNTSARFELAFLEFVQRTYQSQPEFLQEFESIYLLELNSL